MSDKTPVIELRSVDKSFGPIDVLHEISLKVHEGEVLCLLGDNGAGKSTLIKTLAGVHKPTRGEILLNGKQMSFDRPKDAQEMGIATVHQFGGTFPLMSIGRSFFAGVEPTKGWGPLRVMIARPPTRSRSRLSRTSASPVSTTATGSWAAFQAASASRWRSPVPSISVRACLILDEPTAALGVKQAAHVLAHRQRGQAARFGGHLHHPSGDARHGRRRSFCGADSWRYCRRFPQGRENP